MVWKNIKNRVIDVFKVVNRLLVITVENLDLKDLRVNQFVKIGDKKYRVRSVPMIHSTPPQSVLDRDTFTIDYTDDELLDKEAVFTKISVNKLEDLWTTSSFFMV